MNSNSTATTKTALYPITPTNNAGAEEIKNADIYQALLDYTPNYTWVMDENRKIVYSNKSLLHHFKNDGTVIHNGIVTSLPNQIMSIINANYAATCKNNETVKSIFKSSHADGSENVFQVTTFPFIGKNGEKFVGGEAINITASHHTEQEIKKINERLLYITHATSESIWEWNIRTGHIYRNMALHNMIGFQLENTQDLSWWFKRIHPDDRKKTKDNIDTVLAEKLQSWESEYRFLCADDTYKTIYDRGFVVYENNQPVKMIGSLQDISETKELEIKLIDEKLKKQKELAEAIINAQEEERTKIAHELHDNVNQLLTTAKLYVEMLKPVSGNDIMMVNKTKEIIMEALGEIRDISKNMTLPFLRDQGLAESIEELLEDIKVTRQYDIYFTFAGGEQENISEGKKIAIFRIMQEQLKNIIKHSQGRMIIVHLEFETNYVKLCVTDDGIGFDASEKRKGIGLSNIYDRVKLYDGTVELKTAPGKGCAITVIIPLD